VRAIVLLSHAPVLDDFGSELLHFLLAIRLFNRCKFEDSCFQISDAMPEWPEIHICFAGAARLHSKLERSVKDAFPQPRGERRVPDL